MTDSTRAAFEAAIEHATKLGMQAGMEAANKAWEEQLPKLLAQASQAARQSALEAAVKALEPLREAYDTGGDCSAGMGFMDAIEAATAAIRSLANPAERPEGEKT